MPAYVVEHDVEAVGEQPGHLRPDFLAVRVTVQEQHRRPAVRSGPGAVLRHAQPHPVRPRDEPLPHRPGVAAPAEVPAVRAGPTDRTAVTNRATATVHTATPFRVPPDRHTARAHQH